MTTVENETMHRAGRYIRQVEGYRAFAPNALPPSPPVQIAGELQQLLSLADRVLGRLDGSIQTLPNPDLFVYMYVRKEAVLSSQIEGTQSSLHDVLAAEAQIMSPERPNDVAEVINYIAAMNYGLVRLETLPVSVRLIREIHERLLLGTRGSALMPGEIRSTQNWIGPAGCTLNQARYVPPPPQEVAGHLAALEQFLHSAADIPLLIRVGYAHAQFETIHPFLDGNGRVGRLLITFLLCEQEVLLKPVLYLSHYFKQHRQEYYDRLQAVRDHGDWEGWLVFFLKGVIEVAKEATDTVRNILTLREANRQLITDTYGRVAGNGIKVLEYLFQSPIIEVKDIENITGTTYQAANELVGRMVDSEIVEEITGALRNRKFMYRSYTNLFDS